MSVFLLFFLFLEIINCVLCAEKNTPDTTTTLFSRMFHNLCSDWVSPGKKKGDVGGSVLDYVAVPSLAHSDNPIILHNLRINNIVYV